MKKVEQALSFSLKNEMTTKGGFSPAKGQEDKVTACTNARDEYSWS